MIPAKDAGPTNLRRCHHPKPNSLRLSRGRTRRSRSARASASIALVVVVVAAAAKEMIDPCLAFSFPSFSGREARGAARHDRQRHYRADHKFQQQHQFQAILLPSLSSPSLLLALNDGADESSAGSGDGGGDDELSKLRSKRSQIKRVKKDTMEEAQEKLALSTEPVVDLDLDTLPEFTFERKSIVPKSKKDDDNNNNDGDANDEKGQSTSKKEASNNAPIVDFMADYADENDFHVANRIGVTSLCWGDTSKNFVATSQKLPKRAQKQGKFVAGDVQLAVAKLLAGGVTLVETSPAYGSSGSGSKLSAEDILGQTLHSPQLDLSSYPEPVLVESMRSSWLSTLLLRPGASMVSSLEGSLSRLSGKSSAGTAMSSVDLFLAPPVPLGGRLVPTRWIAAGLAQQVESGQANYVGVSGITSRSALERLIRHLDNKYECSLTANAFSLSMTNTKHLNMIDVCKGCNVIPFILDPLDNGLASGIFTATNPSGGGVGTKFSFKVLDKLQPLHSVQETVAERVRTRVIRGMRDTQERFKSKYGPPPSINTDISTTQIALQWIIAKGGVPLVPVNNPSQADDVLGCLGWTLNDDEVAMLDSAIALCKL